MEPKLDVHLMWCDIIHVYLRNKGCQVVQQWGISGAHRNLCVLPREAKTSVLNHSSVTAVCISEEDCGMWKQKETRLNQCVFPRVGT